MPILSMPYSANNLHWNITLERVRPEGRTLFYRYGQYVTAETLTRPPNNLKLVQPTKILIHNQLVNKANARLPTFSHNPHLAAHHICLTLNIILQITTRRLFDISMGKSTEPLKTRQYVTAETLTIQSNSVFASFLVTHRIFL